MVFYACGFCFLVEQLEWFVDWFVGKAEGAVVHGHHPAGLEVEEGASGVGRIRVNVAELRRIVGADGKQSEFGRKAVTDFLNPAK